MVKFYRLYSVELTILSRLLENLLMFKGTAHPKSKTLSFSFRKTTRLLFETSVGLHYVPRAVTGMQAAFSISLNESR